MGGARNLSKADVSRLAHVVLQVLPGGGLRKPSYEYAEFGIRGRCGAVATVVAGTTTAIAATSTHRRTATGGATTTPATSTPGKLDLQAEEDSMSCKSDLHT